MINVMHASNAIKSIAPTPIPVQQHENRFDSQMNKFWKNQETIVKAIDSKTEDFVGQTSFDLKVDTVKYSGVELTCDPEVRVIVSKACELFISDLTLNSWINTEDGKRKLMIIEDLKKSIYENDKFDFLISVCSKYK